MKKTKNYNMDYDTTFSKAITSATKNFQILKRDQKNGIIECKTETSIWSWGESIIIRVIQINTQKTQITIESSSTMQLFDWGKSKENIEFFFNTLESK